MRESYIKVTCDICKYAKLFKASPDLLLGPKPPKGFVDPRENTESGTRGVLICQNCFDRAKACKTKEDATRQPEAKPYEVRDAQ